MIEFYFLCFLFFFIYTVTKDIKAKGKLDIILAQNKDNAPPRVKAFNGRTMGQLNTIGPIEKNGSVRVVVFKDEDKKNFIFIYF